MTIDTACSSSLIGTYRKTPIFRTILNFCFVGYLEANASAVSFLIAFLPSCLLPDSVESCKYWVLTRGVSAW